MIAIAIAAADSLHRCSTVGRSSQPRVARKSIQCNGRKHLLSQQQAAIDIEACRQYRCMGIARFPPRVFFLLFATRTDIHHHHHHHYYYHHHLHHIIFITSSSSHPPPPPPHHQDTSHEPVVVTYLLGGDPRLLLLLLPAAVEAVGDDPFFFRCWGATLFDRA